MPGFQYSSSPPSTPSRSTNNAFSFGSTNNPTTTPAGPPPSSVGSFTPAGPPPSSFYGSTMRSPTPNKSFSYSQQSEYDIPDLQSPNFSSPIFSRPASKPQRPVFGNNSRPSQRSLSSPSLESEEEEEEDTRYHSGAQTGKRYEDSYSSDNGMDEDGDYEDEDMDDYRSEPRGTKSNRNVFNQQSNSGRTSATPSHLRKSTGNRLVDFRGSLERSQYINEKSSDYGRIAKDLSNALGVPVVDERGFVILGTEAIITKLYEEGVVKSHNEQMLQRALAVIPSELTELWKHYEKGIEAYTSEEYVSGIGPGPGASDFAKANYLANLALQIHHSKPVERGFETVIKPLPQVLLEWLTTHHDPFPNQIAELLLNKPSPSAHHLFWSIVHNNVLRGNVVGVINCLKGAGWKWAWSGEQEMNAQGEEKGYTGVALTSVEKVVDDAINVISQCPSFRDDWDIRGSDWTLFRLRISQAQEDLRVFAEGGDQKQITFESDRFGKSSLRHSQSGSYSRLAKKAASRVPWNIYQNLLTMYNIFMGESVAIIENAQDWLEATVGLFVWRDERKDDRRLAPGRSINSLRASVNDHEPDNYLRRLRRAFDAATSSETDFQINSMNPVEVGLACLFEGDIESLTCIVRAWSLPIASALCEVASLAGWLPRTEPQALLGDLDAESIGVLGAFEKTPDGAKDLALISYANRLLELDEIAGLVDGKEIAREGWEIAIAVLGRLDSTDRSEQRVQDILEKIELDTSNTVDKLWRLLNDLGMTNKAESIALQYATSLARDTHSYGEALWYYALAHNTTKVKDVLDTLIISSLIYSTAYPPESELDDHLQRLLSSPKNALDEMSRMDVTAAELVHTSLSGYATLRKFYTLRDEEVNLQPGTKPSLGPIARKKEAANALLAVIVSSDDNIRGGLFDENCGAVVPVEYILALLGEAMPFVNQPNFLLTTSQINILLRTIEDIQGVGPRIYDMCNDFLQAVIASASGLKNSTPNDLLRKSSSSSGLNGSYSMVGSSMQASQFQKSVASSGMLVKSDIRRGWDWRRDIRAGMGAEDILRVLRLGLAKDLARCWLVEVDSRG